MIHKMVDKGSVAFARFFLLAMLLVTISVGKVGMVNAQSDALVVYLPLILKPDIPPTPPTLDAIANSDGDGTYTVSWRASSGAIDYTLEEDDNASFTSPSVAYTGSALTHNVSRQAQGTHYYRVKAGNAAGVSAWSNIQSVIVLPAPVHYVGSSPSVSFDVIGNQVCNFKITVPFGINATCRITPDCMDITNNDFGVVSSEVGAIFVIDGTFDSDTHATGNYSVSMCRNSLIIPASSGTWNASKTASE